MAFGSRPDEAPGNAGIYVGTVTAVDDAVAYVEVPRLAPGFEYPARFPAELVAGPPPATGSAGTHGHDAPTVTLDTEEGGHTHGAGTLATGAASAGTAHTHAVNGATGSDGAHGHDASVTDVAEAGAHTHPLPTTPLSVGDDVAVAFLEGGRDELVILVRLA